MLKNYKLISKKNSRGKMCYVFVYTGTDTKKEGHQYTFVDGVLFFRDTATLTSRTSANNYGWESIDDSDYRYHIFWTEFEAALKGGD